MFRLDTVIGVTVSGDLKVRQAAALIRSSLLYLFNLSSLHRLSVITIVASNLSTDKV